MPERSELNEGPLAGAWRRWQRRNSLEARNFFAAVALELEVSLSLADWISGGCGASVALYYEKSATGLVLLGPPARPWSHDLGDCLTEKATSQNC